MRSPLSRREVLQHGATLVAATRAAAVEPVTALRASARGGAGRFDPGDFATVGVFGLDWLLDPLFTRLLDEIAASPGAVRGIRAFGVLSLGRDKTFPTVTGGVWEDPAAPMAFSRSLDALDALVSRRLVPFLPLTFFPRAVSPEPTVPPPDWSRWKELVRGFLGAAVRRFGREEVARWWFEVWNEPNMPPFWEGSFDRYLDLYRATAAAVQASGYRIRLGGPVVAYMPGGEGKALVERFLQMLAREPNLPCSFISLHRKGVWVNEEREPELGRLVDAAEETAQAVLRIVPGRARGLAVVNDEADMLVGFDRPYPPRMTSQFPAWLASTAIAYDDLSARYAAQGLRFLAFSDNANQQLARGPFDGRRTLMTPFSDETDLIKLPVYAFYELLRLMGPHRGTLLAGTLPPSLQHLVTVGRHGIAVLLAHYADSATIVIDYELSDIPWPVVNTAVFCIDANHTNPQAKATDPVAMRQAQELGTLRPLRSGIRPESGKLRERLEVGPYSTSLLWVTPWRDSSPEAPRRVEAKRLEGGSRVVLRWEPDPNPAFYSYVVTRSGDPITPMPLRSAFWVDAAAPAGPLVYEVSAISVSGKRSSPTAGSSLAPLP